MSFASSAIATSAIAAISGTPEPAPPPSIKTCSRFIKTDVGGRYIVSFELVECDAGSITIQLGGIDVFTAVSTPGVYTTTVTALLAPSSLFEIIGTEEFFGEVDNVSVKRLYWLVDESCIIKDTLNIEGVSDADTPTKVSIQYATLDDEAYTPVEKNAPYTLPDAEADAIPLIETSLSMPGIFRESEAVLKAKARAFRMANRVRVSWTTKDVGIALQRGVVCQVKHALRGVDILVLVDSVQMVGYGRHKVSGLRYDDNHYPADTEGYETPGTVPVGAIVMLSGTSVPSGWAEYTAANGKFIMGADDADAAYEPGDTGGSATYAGFSGNTASGGAHNGSTEEGFETESFTGMSGSGSGYFYQPDNTMVGGHAHTYSTGTITPSLQRRENILIEKTGSPGAQFPRRALVFGIPGLTVPDVSRSTAYAGRLLKAASASANLGTTSQTISISTGSEDDEHDHYSRTFIVNGSPTAVTFTPPRSDVGVGGGVHLHSLVLALQTLPRQYSLALYAGTADYDVTPGMICLWAGSLGSLPADWSLCTGEDGTPDLRKRFISIAAVGMEGASGNNTLSVSGVTAKVGHDHDSNPTTTYTYATRTMRHANNAKHDHSVEASASYKPPYYVLAAIMYNP